MTELFASSIDLMVVGMGTVFAFLILLIFATNLMSKFVIRFAPEAPDVPIAKFAAPSNAAADDKQLIAVISAAIQQHRKKP